MKKISSLCAISIVVLFSYGCSIMKSKKDSGPTAAQLEEQNKGALAIASERLEKMVSEAKGNPKSTDYLATDLFLKANMSLMEGDFLTASALFRYVVELAPEDEFVLKKYAVSLIKVGEMEAAQAVLEKLFFKSQDEKVGLILAGIYTATDKENKAREVYQKILVKNPKSEDACVFLGKSYALSQRTKYSIQLLQDCAKNDPKNGMYDYYIGKIYIDLGQIPLAVSSFKKAYERQPDLSQAVNALGVLYEEREQFNAAIDMYKKHLKSKASDVTILNRIVQVLFLREKYEEVIPYAEKLSDLDPDNLNLKVKLGILYTDTKRYSEAISAFKDILTVMPQSDKILYYLGAIYQELNQLQESIEYFNQIPATSGLYQDSSIQVANMLSTLAQIEYQKKEQEKWKSAFLNHVNKKIEELRDLRVEFSVIKSGFFEGVSQYKSAMEAMMVVQDEANFSVQHKYYLANLYEKERRYEESTALIMGIIKKEPKNAHAWNFLGYSLLERGDEMDKAFEYIQKALAINPQDGYIRDSLGWYYYKKGDVKKALSELRFALSKVPDDVEILKHLAIIHKEMKDFKKANDFYRAALKNAKYESERLDIMSSIEFINNQRLPASRPE